MSDELLKLKQASEEHPRDPDARVRYLESLLANREAELQLYRELKHAIHNLEPHIGSMRGTRMLERYGPEAKERWEMVENCLSRIAHHFPLPAEGGQ